MSKFKPAWLSPPCDTIKDFLDEFGNYEVLFDEIGGSDLRLLLHNRKRMHIHLIDAAINLRKEDPTRKVRVYPPSPGFVAGRLAVQEWFGRDRGWVSTTMWLCCLPGCPVTWHANSHWLTYRHYPASIIPRRNCQLSSLDLAAASHSVGTADRPATVL